MADGMAKIDYGPLTGLIGTWTGQNGMDVAPEPDGAEKSPFVDSIVFSEVGDVTNAESQCLSALCYEQIVRRKSNNEVFHHERGYWMWDPETRIVMQSFCIPRGVTVLAGGAYDGEMDEHGRVILNVRAALDNTDWRIIQSPFMQEKARTTAFSHRVAVGNDTLNYFEMTIVDIYGKTFEHTDENELVRIA